jgi:hypothetical protein
MHQHQMSHILQDEAPCHRAKFVTKWFQERPKIQLIAWPGNSSDLNPIENVWACMKRQLRNMNPADMEDWKRCITELWAIKADDSDHLKKLVESRE